MVLAGWTNEALEKRANHLPILRLSGTQEIARVALFLPAPEWGYISGATLVVDGGWSRPVPHDRKVSRRKAGQV